MNQNWVTSTESSRNTALAPQPTLISHVCSNFEDRSGNMEHVAAFGMFEHSKYLRKLQYLEYYGVGDSKAYEAVKNIHGKNSVTKLECIGQVQKRVELHVRKLKRNITSLGGEGKFTGKLINELQN
ncbi:uncharacterized protein TNCV_3374951 [Trichonephila clavipes]|nr:uncharacterized protein TNCV_3374951 [Trichonephila clavipes]